MKILFTIFVLFLLSACGDKSKSSKKIIETPVILSLQQIIASPVPDSLVITISASDMQTQIYRMIYDPNQTDIKFDDLPPGLDRLIEVNMIKASKILFSGSALRDLIQGSLNTIQITLNAQFTHLAAQIPLGLNNPLGIVGGYITLERNGITISDSLEINGGTGRFLLTPVFWGNNYNVEVRLWDAQNKDLYVHTSQINILSDADSELVLNLESLLTGVAIQLHLMDVPTTDLHFILPGSSLRPPQSIGDLVISELLPNPKTSGNDYEWIELFNGSTDTLSLLGCLIGKTSTSSTASTVFEVTEPLSIGPADYLVLGRDSVDFADWHYQGFTLANSSQSVVVNCGGVVIDSMHYYSATDLVNPYPEVVGASLQLNLEHYYNRLLGVNWCSGGNSVVYEISSLEIQGTPGAMNSCTADN